MDTPEGPSISDDGVTISSEFVIEVSFFQGAKLSQIKKGVERGIAAKLDIPSKRVNVHTITEYAGVRDSKVEVDISRYDKTESIPELESLIHVKLDMECQAVTDVKNVNCVDMNSIQ